MTKTMNCMMRVTATIVACHCWLLAALADEWDNTNYAPTNIVQLGKTNLPIVFIDTRLGGSDITPIHKDYRIAVRMKIIANEDGVNYGDTLAHPGQTTDYEGWVGIKYRGNSSFNYAKKKPLGFKTLATGDVDGKKEKVKLLGMAKDNDWVLLAPYHDRSMIRDVLVFELARPYFEYTPTGRHCEVVMDGVYSGVYVLCEKPGKGKNRLNLDDPGDEGDELTGGYQVQVDSNDEEHYYTSKYKAKDESGRNFMFNNTVYFQYKFPEYDDMMPDHPAQLNYIDNRIAAMEDALNSSNFKNPETGYRKYIDVQSFVDNMLTQEASGNPDAYRRSTNLYKRRDSVDPRFKICLWDFNLAFGNSLHELTVGDKWMYVNITAMQLIRPNPIPFWWTRLMEDAYYVDCVKSRWTEYRRTNYTKKHINEVIDSLVNVLEVGGARERNYEVWPTWDESIYLSLNNTKNYEEEIAYLRSWIDHRIDWMDEQLGFDPNAKIDGDVNGDGTVDVGDVMAIINIMASPLDPPEGGMNGDVNGDGTVDVGDVMAVINIMARVGK